MRHARQLAAAALVARLAVAPTTATTGGRRAASWSRPTTPMSAPRTRRCRPRSRATSSTSPVEDNAAVKAGDVIARIDDGDYRLAVETAQDQVGVQQATIERLGKQIVAQQAAVDQAKAQLASAKAGATRADLELEAPAGPGDAADQQPAVARAGAGQPRPGRRRRCRPARPPSKLRPPMSTC